MAKVRDRGEVLGFGVPTALFLPEVAYLGITNGHQFIANDFFAFMYCLACVGFASVPLMAWRRGGGRYADPGFLRSAWFPWLFTTGQGVAYSSAHGDANIFVLIAGWGAFIYAGMVALYFLARTLWAVDDDQAAPPSEAAATEPGARIRRARTTVRPADLLAASTMRICSRRVFVAQADDSAHTVSWPESAS